MSLTSSGHLLLLPPPPPHANPVLLCSQCLGQPTSGRPLVWPGSVAGLSCGQAQWPASRVARLSGEPPVWPGWRLWRLGVPPQTETQAVIRLWRGLLPKLFSHFSLSCSASEGTHSLGWSHSFSVFSSATFCRTTGGILNRQTSNDCNDLICVAVCHVVVELERGEPSLSFTALLPAACRGPRFPLVPLGLCLPSGCLVFHCAGPSPVHALVLPCPQPFFFVSSGHSIAPAHSFCYCSVAFGKCQEGGF